MVVHPRREETRANHLAERVAERDSVAGFDRGFDVEDSREAVAGIDHDEVVVLSGVRFRRCGDGSGGDDFARDGTRRGGLSGGVVVLVIGRPPLSLVGVEVDSAPLLVGGVRRVVQRESGEPFEEFGTDRDHRPHIGDARV